MKFLSIFHFLNHFRASESRIKNFSIDLRYDFQIQAFWLVKSSPMASKQPTITVKFQHSVNLCLKIYLQYRAQLVQVKIWPQQSHLRKTLIGISSAAAAYEDFCVQLIWMHRTKESFETPASVPLWNCLFEIEKKANFWSPYKLEICLFGGWTSLDSGSKAQALTNWGISSVGRKPKANKWLSADFMIKSGPQQRFVSIGFS